jgi:hypothetical protein
MLQPARRQGAEMRKLLLLVGIVSSCVSPAYADPVTLSGSGALKDVSGFQSLLGWNAAPGDPFTFSLSFDNTPSIDTEPAPDIARYPLGSGTASITSGTNTPKSSPVTNLFGLIGQDGGIGLAGFPAGFGYPPDKAVFNISLYATGKPLKQTPWPGNIAAALNAEPDNFFQLGVSVDPTESDVVLGATGLRYAQNPEPVPESPSVLLLGIGLLLAGARPWQMRR